MTDIFVQLIDSSPELSDIHKNAFLRIHDRMEAVDLLDDSMMGDLYFLLASTCWVDDQPTVYDCVEQGDVPAAVQPIVPRVRATAKQWMHDQVNVHQLSNIMGPQNRAVVAKNVRERFVRAGVAIGSVVTIVDHATSLAIHKTARVARALPHAISTTVREA
jgi:hypothetical protein